MRILMVAAENGALPNAKVGGIGDVVRDVPPVLADKEHEVLVVIPSYGYLHKQSSSKEIGTLSYCFGGAEDHEAVLYKVPGKNPRSGVTHYVIDHPKFVSKNKDGQFEIYHADPDDRPFASDASKYARFCMAVAQEITEKKFDKVDCLHLHDWHAAFLFLLRKSHASYSELKKIRTVYTIHNLALQGVRPFKGDESSLEAWYPELINDCNDFADPRWSDCINPMQVGIMLADAVHAVSPSYADEILYPSDEKKGYYGGEGLEQYIKNAESKDRLIGILNGCEYPKEHVLEKLPYAKLIALLKSNVLRLAGSETGSLSPAHFLAYTRLSIYRKRLRESSLRLSAELVTKKLYSSGRKVARMGCQDWKKF